MKKFAKLTAVMLALVASASNLGTVVSAAETADMSALSASEMQEVAKLLATTDNSIGYYVAYDYYNTSYLASTQHYLAVLADNSDLESNVVTLYLNTNIVGTDYLNDSLFIASAAYADLLTFNSIDDSASTTSKKAIAVSYSLTGSTGTYSELFRYKLDNISSVSTEKALHRYTSYDFGSPTTTLQTTDEFTTLYKCIFALGDVDRNGILDSTDSELVLKYAIKNMAAASDRSEAQAAYDQIAFEMAGDFNQDGKVTVADSLAINKALT